MAGLNRKDAARLARADVVTDVVSVVSRPGGAMGAVISFPEARRALRAALTYGVREDATIIILPVIRIEREEAAPPDSGAETTSPSGRKRRRRASPP
jgi:hypothetical protein